MVIFKETAPYPNGRGAASLFPVFGPGFQQCGEKQCGKIPS
jgi:hypothetical protein